MKVFYVQNEKQLKRIILSDADLELEDLIKLHLLGCDYIESQLPEYECFDPYDDNCRMCKQDMCLLFEEHIHDKDVLNHIYVNQEIDGGKIISQGVIDYNEGDTLEQIEEKIHKLEHKLYVQTINKLIKEGI